MAKVRPAAVAGRFYPGHADELVAQISEMLGAELNSQNITCKALIVPHAGYVYSGPVAGAAYRLLRNHHTIRRVVLLGPCHYVPVSGIAVSSAQSFITPLGTISLDMRAIEALLGLPQVVCNDEAHAPEHSLEVQLPFLQSVLADFELVPLVVGNASANEVAEVLNTVWDGLETLIVVSSDLSHYHDYQTAQRVDADTSKKICCLQADLVGEQACGSYAVNGLLYAAKAHGLRVKQLDLRNSGDTAGDRSRVVGYGAYAFY